MLHNAGCRAEIERRLGELRHDSPRRWGKMSVGQMLWHVNEVMACALGIVAREPVRARLPKRVMKFLVLNMPWMKGAPPVEDPLLGRMSGTEVSRLHAKHRDHHLKQFGV